MSCASQQSIDLKPLGLDGFSRSVASSGENYIVLGFDMTAGETFGVVIDSSSGALEEKTRIGKVDDFIRVGAIARFGSRFLVFGTEMYKTNLYARELHSERSIVIDPGLTFDMDVASAGGTTALLVWANLDNLVGCTEAANCATKYAVVALDDVGAIDRIHMNGMQVLR